MSHRTSTEFGTLVERNVQEMFEILVKNRATLLSMVPFLGTRAEAHKYEWLEYRNDPQTWTVDAQSNAASTFLDFTSTAGIQVGDVLRFETTAGASLSVFAKVTVVVDGTDLTIARVGTDAAIPAAATAYLVSRAKPEFSAESLGDNVTLREVFNYTQIEREDMGLSGTLLSTKFYGLGTEADREKAMDMINFQLKDRLLRIERRLNNSVLYGVRTQRVQGADAGHMGGVLSYLKGQAASQLDASSAAISDTLLNNATEKAGANGADVSSMRMLLCHPHQARKISQFNDSELQIARQDTTTGNFVANFQTDLSGSNGGTAYTIVTDRNFPRNEIALLDPNKIGIVPMLGRELAVTETTDAKDDGYTWKVLGEMTLEMKNASDGHMLLTNVGL